MDVFGGSSYLFYDMITGLKIGFWLGAWLCTNLGIYSTFHRISNMFVEKIMPSVERIEKYVYIVIT